MLVMTLVIYYYARQTLSSGGSLAAAACYATFGQVLPLGQLGESESLFTMFVGSGMLLWHAAYLQCRSPAVGWCLGYALIALGALVKGPQAPAYFVAATGAYLVWRRDWRWLFAPGHAAGLALFGLIIGAWLVPFALMYWDSTDDIWAGLASDRFTRQGLSKHLVTYPLETFGCLLPWSPMCFALLYPSVRRWLRERGQATTFLIIALVVTYPSVWLAAGARGRYYMPMYPCVAVLLGMLIEGTAISAVSAAALLFWQRFLRAIALVVLVGCGTVTAATLGFSPKLADLAQPVEFLGLWIPLALLAASVLAWASWSGVSSGVARFRPQWALLVLGGFLAVAQSGVVINCRLQAANDLNPVVGELKARLGEVELVSLGRVDHRFAYFFETPIRQVAWPERPDSVDQDMVYFCFDRRPSDTAEARSTSDGRLSTTTNGTLPFDWEEVAEIGCDPLNRHVHSRTVVVGRMRRASFDPGRAKFDPAVRTVSYETSANGSAGAGPDRTKPDHTARQPIRQAKHEPVSPTGLR